MGLEKPLPAIQLFTSFEYNCPFNNVITKTIPANIISTIKGEKIGPKTKIIKNIKKTWSKLLIFAKVFVIMYLLCGSDSVVECHLAKVEVAGPNPVSRSRAEVAELADARDLKSLGSDIVPVRARSSAPHRISSPIPKLNKAIWHYSQVVRPRSAKPLFPSSSLGGASKKSRRLSTRFFMYFANA